MKTALVVSGGGSRGAFAVGAIEVLWERGWRFDVISGTSTGALITALATINDIDELVKIYTSVRTKDIIRLNWRRFFRDAIYDTAPLEKLIRRTMKGSRYDALMASPVTALLCRVGFKTGGIFYGSQRLATRPEIQPWGDFEGFVKALLASTNEPTLMPPVHIGEACFDGGVREVVPLQIVTELGAKRVVIIVNGPVDASPMDDPLTSILRIGPRAIDLMTTEIGADDLLEAQAGTDVVVIRPTSPLPGSSLEFNPAEMQQMRVIGQERAKEVLAALPV